MMHRRYSLVRLVVLGALALAARPVTAATGLSLLQQIVDGLQNINTIQGPLGIAVSPSPGDHVYAVGRGDNAVNVFSRNLTTGLLTFVEAQRQGMGGVDGLTVPETVTVSQDGLFVYVGTHSDIVVFGRNTGTGVLTFVENVNVTRGSVAIAISADLAYLYSTAESGGGSVTTYSRNVGTGQLTFVDQVEDNMGGVDGIDRADGIVISPDDKHVYVSGQGDNAVAAFSRNTGTGVLTFLAKYQDGSGGVSGIHVADSVAISPDGAHVYVGSRDAGVGVFGRNAVSGLLTWVEAEQADTPFRFVSIGVTPDGAYVIGAGEDVVMAMTRDGGTGKLTLAGGDGLATVRGLALAPDSQFVYAGSALDAIGTFSFVSQSCSPTPQLGCPQPTLPEKSAVYLKDLFDDKADKITWKWTKGTAVVLGDFGDPVTGNDGFVLCVYDASANPQPVFEGFAPPQGICGGKPCWKLGGTTSFKYKDKLLQPSGLGGATLKSGVAGASSIKVKGKGKPLGMPTLPLTTPVTVQVQSANGNCWEGVFSTPIVTTTESFKAKSD